MTDYTSWRVIGEGTERTCYQNPVDQTRCVKIIRKSRVKQTLREISYFRYLIGRGVPFDHLPKFYGEIKGGGFIGIEQELVHDLLPDKRRTSPIQASPTIRQYMAVPRSKEEIRAFWKAVNELKAYLLRYNILAGGIDENNVVVQQTPSGIKLVVIDGVYDTEWIPVSKYFKFLGRRKMERRWKRFLYWLKIDFPQVNLVDPLAESQA